MNQFSLKLIQLNIILSVFILIFSDNSFCQGKTDIIIDADTGNEVDDLFAVTRSLLEPSWNIFSLNAAHWQTSQWAIPNTMENSHRLNQMLVGYLGMNINTRRGGVSRMYDWGDQAQHSAAAYEIIKKAKDRDPQNKLIIVALGALTNVASALLISPEIEDKIDLFWLGTSYDFEKGILRRNDFNCMMDQQALDHLLFSKVEMHFIPVSVANQMVFHYDQTRRKLEGIHPITDFLIRRWDDHMDGGRQSRVIWDLALVSSIINPEWAEWETITTSKDNGSKEIEYIKDIDENAIKADFFESIKTHLRRK